MLFNNFLPLLARAAGPTNWTQAYSVAPTGNWDGNDGGWSTFAIRVGTPPQYFRVLPSTSGTDTWIPLADQCSTNPARCGAARGVEPFNAAPNSSWSSGVPTGVNGTAVDVGGTCTINRSPQCADPDCVSINGACTTGQCAGRQCCGDPKGACNSECKGVGGICTDQYIGCPCTGPDWNASPQATGGAATNPLLAAGFLSGASTTWKSQGTQQLALASTLNVNGTAQYGSDTLGLGFDESSGLTLPSNPLAGVGAYPFYLGTLGLKATASNSSLLSQLFARRMIPSLSYGYTAGAFYQRPILGSLTLGGYDAVRSGSLNLTADLRANDSNVIVSIESITATNTFSNNGTLLPAQNNLSAIIDTSLPYLYLPQSLCSAFEVAFGLQWNATAQTYVVNATTHQALTNNAPAITFSLSNTTDIVNITLPYAAFDLGAAYPIFPQGTSYFPLRRSQNPSQIILGRAFMQEAYLFVDYETHKYSISQTVFPKVNATTIMTVNHSGTKTVTSASSPTPSASSGSLSKGAIAGIAIGASAAIGLLGALAFFIWRSKHPRHVDEISRTSPSEETSGSETEKDGWTSYSPPPAFQSYRSEQQQQQQQQPNSSPTMEKSLNGFMNDEKSGFSRSNTIGHSLKAPSSSSALNALEKPQGRVVCNVNPWENCELEDPRSPGGATSAGVGTASSTALYSIFSAEKPLPLTPFQRQELPGSAAAKEICATKTWDYDRSSGVRRSQSANGWYGQHQHLQHERDDANHSPANSAPGGFRRSDTTKTGFTTISSDMGRYGSKSSLDSSSTGSRPFSPVDRPPRQKHIFELQADEPGQRSRRTSERKRSAAASPTSVHSSRSAAASPTSPRIM